MTESSVLEGVAPQEEPQEEPQASGWGRERPEQAGFGQHQGGGSQRALVSAWSDTLILTT